MKLTVKNLKGSRFTIEVKPEDTIADVKKNIETVQGSDVYPAAQQMIIHQGQVLNDTTTVEENNISEDSSIVIMLRKIKSSEGEPSSAKVTPATHPTSTGQSTQTISVPSQSVSVVAIPQSATPNPNANPLDLFPQGLPNTSGNLDFLRNSPQFQALRTMVQENPQVLQAMLQELVKHNPQLERVIEEHQVEFLRMMNEVEGEMTEADDVIITPQEREAIERLEAMGFDQAVVVDAFLACNKDEELAANYLLDHMHEFGM